MAKCHNINRKNIIKNIVDDPVIANTNTITITAPQLFATGWPGITP
jgi:hypothetical protein